MFHSLKGSANTRCYHCERLLYYFLLNYYLNLFFIGLTINCLLRWDMTKPASVSNLILLKFKEVLLLSLLAKHRAFRVLEANKVLTYFCSNSLQIVPFLLLCTSLLNCIPQCVTVNEKQLRAFHLCLL